MPGEPFRFLHASDLHLEQPLAGLDEIPDHLRDRLVDAPLAAARSVFDAAVAEAVDFWCWPATCSTQSRRARAACGS